MFLTSKELSLLQEISALCGEIYTAGGHRRAMISVSELQRFDKQKGETLIMHARQYPIITEMADIDMYEAFKGFKVPEQKAFCMPKAKQFSVEALFGDIMLGKKPFPFAADVEMIDAPESAPPPQRKPAPKKKTPAKTQKAEDTKLREQATETYEQLYGRKAGKK